MAKIKVSVERIDGYCNLPTKGSTVDIERMVDENYELHQWEKS